MGRSRSAATPALAFFSLLGHASGQVPGTVARLDHYKYFIRIPDALDTNFTTEARAQRKSTVQLPPCSDMSSYTKLTSTGLFSLVSPANALVPPDPANPASMPGAVVAGSIYNTCWYGLQDHAMGFAANPPMPHGVMLTCRGAEWNHSMAIKKYFGSCYDLSVPYATYEVPEEQQDALLRGDCVSLGSSGFIRLNMTTLAGAIQAPLLNCSSAHTETLSFSVMQTPQFTAWTTGADSTSGGQVLRHNLDSDAAPNQASWDWDAMVAQYEKVFGVAFDTKLPQWPNYWRPTIDDPPLQSAQA